MARTAEVKRDARIGEAEAQRDSNVCEYILITFHKTYHPKSNEFVTR